MKQWIVVAIVRARSCEKQLNIGRIGAVVEEIRVRFVQQRHGAPCTRLLQALQQNGSSVVPANNARGGQVRRHVVVADRLLSPLVGLLLNRDQRANDLALFRLHRDAKLRRSLGAISDQQVHRHSQRACGPEHIVKPKLDELNSPKLFKIVPLDCGAQQRRLHVFPHWEEDVVSIHLQHRDALSLAESDANVSEQIIGVRHLHLLDDILRLARHSACHTHAKTPPFLFSRKNPGFPLLISPRCRCARSLY